MKQLTPNSNPHPLRENDIVEIENKHGIKFPKYLSDFLRKYGGTSTKEINYKDSFWVNFFLPVKSDITPSVDKLITGQKFNYEKENCEWIPFAIDSGGWVFVISLLKDTYGQIWIDRFDSGEENPFEFVAESFEEFINSLQP